jgi:LacI family transcriptional regulator/LacI family repressor for deo operon, udp, cdd, tsx, nupC, and nupG
MQRRAVSISDIAKAAGVSHSTVSRALRDSPLISAAVRGRIQAIAHEMGYMPNEIAQSLQTQRTRTIGLVVPSIADPFFADVFDGVEQVARAAGLSVFVSAAHNDPDQEMAAIETFHRRRVDGVLISSSRLSSPFLKRLNDIRVPVVLINMQAEAQHEHVHSVMIDDRAGACAAVEHLIQLGHRRIGYLGVSNRPLSNQRRLAGYREALQDAGVGMNDHWIVIAPEEDRQYRDDVVAGETLVHVLVEAGVTAIFCYNDMVAIGALMGCREHTIAVPDELSVVGFDDNHVARYVTPPLTTVHQPKLELGKQGMRMLIDLIDERDVQSTMLAPTLVVRASTAAPR